MLGEFSSAAGTVDITSPWGTKYPVKSVVCHVKAAEVVE
jgi:hypothetical protein